MNENKINFTVGPVQASDEVRKIGGEQVPYFRTQEFSDIMIENEKIIKKLAKASETSKTVFITGSGTASMEATIMNVLTNKDKAIVINGGSFGNRFAELCSIHEIPYDEIKMNFGETLKEEQLNIYENKGYTAFVVNLCETSTGVLYDIEMISRFCKKNNLLLIVDSISSFLADPFDMKKLGVDVMITGSQKALACPPGISIIILAEKAIKRVYQNESKCMYLDLKNALENAKRGQTPFTPAVGILRQINTRLKELEKNGGVDQENKRIKELAEDFRNRIKEFPFEIFTDSLSNAVTPLHPLNASANDIFIELKNNYNIWVCPNGGELKDKVFRVGHLGNLTIEDNKKLIKALGDMKKRGLI